MQFNYTIIIPHYNLLELLLRCLNSIPVREDVQVIVVDDCSPSQKEIFNKLQSLNRPFLECYSTPFGGSAGRARNIGLNNAKGKWLIFADADDLFVDDFAEFLDKYVDQEEDVLYFNKITVFSDDIHQETKRDDWLENFFTDYKISKNELHFRKDHCAPWACFIKKTLQERHNVYFDETRYSNDMYFMANIGCLASSILIVDKPIYILTERRESLTNNFFQKEKEAEIRTNVEIKTQLRIKELGYPVDFQHLNLFCNWLFQKNKEEYARAIQRMRAFDLSCLEILKMQLHSKPLLHKIKHYPYRIVIILWFSLITKTSK